MTQIFVKAGLKDPENCNFGGFVNFVSSACCGMYFIPLSDDKHRFVRESSKKGIGNTRQNSV